MKKDELRRRAEAKLRELKKTAPLAPATEADALRLVHELQVHQIELEMQNEEVMQARAELEEALRQYTDLYDFAPAGYFTLARDGTIQRVNLTGAKLLGAERGAVIKRRFGVFVSAPSRATFNTFLENVFESRQNGTCEVALLKDGPDPLWAHIEATLAEAVPGQRAACRAVVADISAAKRAEDALRHSEQHFRNLAQALPDAVFTLELPAQKVIYFNHDNFLGYSRSELMADISLLNARHPEDAVTFVAHWQQSINGETPAPIEYRVRNRAGDLNWVERREVVQARTAAGKPKQILVILSMITERKQAVEVLQHLSTHDALTGLYNRRYFEEELARLERGRRYPISLVIADVDRLKETNDHLGHTAGDALLKRVAQVLTVAFRAEDVVTRIGGDEFAVLLPATDPATAGVSLRRVRRAIQENNSVHIGTPLRLSLGVSTAETPAELAGVLKQADAAMYREKRARDAA